MTVPGWAQQFPAQRWATVELDLAQPLPDRPLPGVDVADVWLLSAGAAVARGSVPVRAGVLDGREVAELLAPQASWPLLQARLGRAAVAAPGPLAATVVLCTRDRPQGLERCLASLAALDPPVAEVVVVDNGSDPAAVRAAAARHGATYVHEPRTGLSRARNAGLAQVRTDLALFTDDDVEVTPTWAAELVACFDDPLVAVAAGLVRPAHLDGLAEQLFERWSGFSLRGLQRRDVDGAASGPWGAGGVGASASMAVRVAEVRALGGLAEHLDAGMPTSSGGDTMLVHGLLQAGHRAVYAPRAVAFHSHRASLPALETVLNGYGRGMASYALEAVRRDPSPGAALSAYRLVVPYVGGRARDALLRRPGALPVPLAAAEVRGALSAPRALRQALQLAPSAPARRPDLGHAWLDRLLADRPAPPAVVRELPRISVVVPTRGRAARACALVRALQAAAYDDARVELVVALDGDLDGTGQALEALDVPRRPRLVRLAPSGTDPHAGQGAGAARNAGAAGATGEVLLFLDDDVEPVDDRLLLAHGGAHRPGAGTLQVGMCPPRLRDQAGWLDQGARGWWVDQTRRLRGDEPLLFTDVTSADLSVRREAFLAAGGFLPLPRREDWELGLRLEPVALPAAAVVHQLDTDLRTFLADRRREGAGDALLVARHPHAVGALPLGEAATAGPRRLRAVRAAVEHAPDRELLAPAAAAALGALEAAGLRGRWSRTLGLAVLGQYWAGVGDALGSWAAVEALLAEAAALPAGGSYDAVTDELRMPGRGQACEVEVRLAGRVLGVLPLRVGGTPFSRQRFVSAVLGRWPAQVLAATALAA